MSPNAAWKRILDISPRVQEAITHRLPVVALETAVITHGLPYPANWELAIRMVDAVHLAGAVPAVIGVYQGRIRVGMTGDEIEDLARRSRARLLPPEARLSGWEEPPAKVSVRDLAALVVREGARAYGGTTVAATAWIAHLVGIRFFATGGIGGVHLHPSYDISADLPTLARTPVLVVSAGAKAVLDLDATVEYLETWGIPVLGYQTVHFPAFFSRESDWKVPHPLWPTGPLTAEEKAARIAYLHWHVLKQPSGVLLAVPPPKSDSSSIQPLPWAEVKRTVQQAQTEAEEQGIRGAEVTPFLLDRLAQLTKARTVEINIELLLNNARIAAQVARHYWAYRREEE
ncbi:MAG: pseudouridine-5'-phosphate glycosidase [Chloroflexi bacterium]|nr:pseudouridine-5'-phosphate glycosidase [Chloroflexota bacterium]